MWYDYWFLGPTQRRPLPSLPTLIHFTTRDKISSPESREEKATSPLATLKTKLVPRIDKVPTTTTKSSTVYTTSSVSTLLVSKG